MTITLSSTRRRLRVALAVFAVGGGLVCLGAPSSALAATQIGQTFVPDSGYGAGTYLQSVTPAGEYSAPSAGVITSWSYRAGSSPALILKLKVARSAGGDDITIVGESVSKSPVLDQLNTYTDVRIPVQSGDFIGLYNDTLNGLLSRDTAGYGTHSLVGEDPLPGDTDTYFGPSPLPQLDVSAKVEADCDGDHFGDETQDPDTSSCNPATPPAPPPAGTASAPTGQRAAAKKRCKKKFEKGPKRAKCLKKAKKLPV
jgi:hypothetical protein